MKDEWAVHKAFRLQVAEADARRTPPYRLWLVTPESDSRGSNRLSLCSLEVDTEMSFDGAMGSNRMGTGTTLSVFAVP